MNEEHQVALSQTTARTDRPFGFLFTAVFFIVGLWPLMKGGTPHVWALLVGGAFLLASLLAPALLRIPNRLWMGLGAILHRLVSPVILGLMFFVVVTPIGIAMRVTGRDPLRLRFDKTLASYWIKRDPPGPSPDSMKNQF